MKTQYLNVDEFAKRIGKGRNAVIAMIKIGEIIAEDHRSPGSSIARYRIAASEEARWRQGRRTTGSRAMPPTRTGPQARARSQTPSATVELFV